MDSLLPFILLIALSVILSQKKKKKQSEEESSRILSAGVSVGRFLPGKEGAGAPPLFYGSDACVHYF